MTFDGHPYFSKYRFKMRSGTGANSITETYDYNIRGWLAEKKSDVFDMDLRYNDPQMADIQPSWTGNITEWEWKHKGAGSDNTPNTYAFSYDKLSRLTDSQLFQYSNDQWQRSGSFEEWLGAGDVDAYDKNGNILSLMRSSATGSIMDGFRYEYNGNQLTKLYLDWEDDSDFVTYDYDANGNCMVDGLNALKLEYNYLNLTSGVRDISDNPLAAYRWLADGTKVGVVDDSGAGFEYVGSLIYKRNGSGLALESAAFGSGRIMVSEGSSGAVFTPNYFITDHLGSTRVVVEADGTVSERNDYLPFGGRWEVSGAAITDNRFRFSGKEDQTTGNLPYQDFGARFLGKKLPIWTSVDPLAEKYYSISPYAYVGNNPIRRTDPDGRDWKDKVQGVLRGIVTNLFPGSNLRESYVPNNPTDYNNALANTDAASTVVGGLMMIDGIKNGTVGATGLASAGVVTVSGAGAPVGGTIAVGSGVLIGAGVIETAVGANLMNGAGNNAQKGYNYGKDRDKGGTTETTKTRKTEGADGASSKHIIEKDAQGNTISKTHQVTDKDGKVIHQHQDYVPQNVPNGLKSSTRQFPDEWSKYKKIND